MGTVGGNGGSWPPDNGGPPEDLPELPPEWGDVVFSEEENYYFRLAQHRDWLLALIDRRAGFVQPEFRRAELRNAVEKLTGDYLPLLLRAAADISHDWASLESVPSKTLPGQRVND